MAGDEDYMTTCCSSGKARVYYNIPLQGGLKYRLKGESIWRLISANEPLTSSCVFLEYHQTPNESYFVNFYSSTNTIEDYFIINEPFSSAVSIEDFLSNNIIVKRVGVKGYGGYSLFSNDLTYKLKKKNGQEPPKKYKFTVTGTETNTKYLEINVEGGCPDVQVIPCKFDPAKEKYFDVELIPDGTVDLFGVPVLTPPVKECIELTTTGNQVVIEKVKTIKRFGTVLDETLEERTILRDLRSPSGCPPPQVRVVCCNTPDCKDKKKECPRETTCELVCNGWKCCYRNGVLIKSIRL